MNKCWKWEPWLYLLADGVMWTKVYFSGCHSESALSQLMFKLSMSVIPTLHYIIDDFL